MKDESQYSASAETGTRSQGLGEPTESNAIRIPEISLPKGGGAIKGIDEKFQVNSSNGTASFSLQLPVTPGRHGMTPGLALAYNTGSGNGPLGLGWSFTIPVIKRKTDNQIPRYQEGNDEDVFMFSGGEDLQRKLNEDGGNWTPVTSETSDFLVQQYCPRVEGEFSRIERITDKNNGRQYWKVTSRTNVTTFFGYSPSACIADPRHETRIYAWLPEFSYDDQGNWIHYFHKQENSENVAETLHEQNRHNELASFTNTYLKRVRYGNTQAHFPATPYAPDLPAPSAEFRFEVVLDYGEHGLEMPHPDEIASWDSRPDPFSSYRSGFEIRTYRRCHRVLMFHRFSELGAEPCLVRSLDLAYSASSINSSGQCEVSYLSSATQKGYIRRNDGSYSMRAFPPMTFTYQQLEWDQSAYTVARDSMENAPAGLANGYQWVDLYGEGISGILSEQAEGWYFKDNYGDISDDHRVHLGPARQVLRRPSLGSLNAGTLSLQDLDSDGRKQLVLLQDGLSGYFEQAEDGGYQPFSDFTGIPNLDLQGPQLRLVDLDGDGKAELLITEEQAFVWYPGKGKAGYGEPIRSLLPSDEEKGPAIVFADRDLQESILLADMSGDGLSDIVRVRNGEICYWPNLGHGRFGAKVSMSNAPLFDQPDLFDPQLLQVGDVSGTGTTDVIYLGKNRFRAFLNLSGNAWSDVHEISPFFPLHSHSQVALADLLGTGTACLVWSSGLPAHAQAPMRYLDLMGSRKPHVLTGVTNNLGKETRLEYKSSTWYYLKDKLEGHPWATKLPFPVQVVHKVTVEDKISQTRFSSVYHYRHGYYDHAEREFRGFGLVEQTDTEAFGAWSANNAHTRLEQSEELYQPPVLRRTWYHLGTFENRENILQQFAAEYWDKVYERRFPLDTLNYTEPGLPDGQVVAAPHLNDPTVLDRMGAAEWREALRACKGMVLRQEVFALDGNDEDEESMKMQAKPYLVTTHNCQVQLLQPRASQQHAVYMVTEQESLSLQCERNPADARIAHGLNTKINEYGQILEAFNVVYPRQIVDASLPQAVQDIQARSLITASEIQYTNDVDAPEAYRIRLVASETSHEITGLSPSGLLFQIADFQDVLGAGSTEISYQSTAGGLVPERRRIEQAQTLYYDDDLGDPLPLGSMGRTGLTYESYQLAYTQDLLNEVFGPRVANLAALMAEGGYVQREGNWWVPSGTVEYFGAAGTISDAQMRFFSPQAYQDAFGAVTSVSYYGTDFLLVQTVTDPLGNQSTVEQFDFRSLSPLRLRDMNANLTEVLLDELGLVKATAVLGKGTEADDLLGLSAITDGAELALIQQYFTLSDTVALRAAAAQLLQHATTRFVYDFDRYLLSWELRDEQLSSNNGTLPCEVVDLLPAVSGSIQREQHHQVNPASPLQLSFSYSNGMGQVVMQKSQAEPGEALNLDIQPDCDYAVTTVDTRPGNQLRWIGNGRTVLNNKGNPVKQYEPYFSVNPFFEDAKELVERGVTPLVHYDALGRNVRTEMPDGTLARVEFDTWQQRTFDANDTVLESQWYIDRGSPDPAGAAPNTDDALAAWKAAQHANTPTVAHFDSLGRAVFTLAHNRVDGLDEFYGTRLDLDIEGNPQRVVDARGNAVMQFRHDLLGRQIYENSMDAGEGWGILNVAGNPLRSWDSKGNSLRQVYDALQRPGHVFLSQQANPETLVSRTVYGEAHAQAETLNLRGQAYQLFDGAGLATTLEIDFKGNVLNAQRRLAREYRATMDWSVLANLNDLAAIDLAAEAMLEAEVFATSGTYDALNRPVSVISPDASEMLPAYNEAGLLGQVSVRIKGALVARPFVSSIHYNARGQRERIVYATDDAQNFSTNYHYDPITLQLTRLHTLRHLDNSALQDLNYTYDPSGNVTAIRDDAQQTVFFGNSMVEPSSAYTYDALYRLVRAEGREHAAQNNTQRDANPFQPLVGIPFPNSPEALQRYVQQYSYDEVGNVLGMRHQGGNVLRWNRRYQYAATGNRLLGTSLPGDLEGQYSATYSYDVKGNMTTMPHLPLMEWDYRDQLSATSRQVVNSGTPETTYYVYDSSGQRRRKVTERQAAQGATPTRMKERLYLGGFEIYREYANDGTTVTLERESLDIADGNQRIALVDSRTLGTDAAPAQSLRYQLGNHLGSASLELDELAAVISYEEYHPYGTSAYRAGRSLAEVSLKRYRYTGKERDEETELSYHGARYYAPWLARWTAADPIGIGDGVNVYAYVGGNPVMLHDPGGMAGRRKKFKGEPPPKLPGKQYKGVTKKLVRELGKGLPDGNSGAGNTDRDPPSVSQDDEPDGRDADSKASQDSKTSKKSNSGSGIAERDPSGGKLEPSGGKSGAGGGDPRYQPKSKGPRFDPPPSPWNTTVNPFPENPSAPVGSDAILDKKEKIMQQPVPTLKPKKTTGGLFRRVMGELAEGGSKIIPGVGVGVGGVMILKSFEEGNYLQGTLDAVGMIPIIGDVVDIGVTAYEITRAIDEGTGFTDWLVGFSEEVEKLPPAYRKRVGRGSPGFLKPKKRAKPKPKPVPPPTTYYEFEDHLVTPEYTPGPRWHLIS